MLDQHLEANKKYIVGGWGSVNPNVKGPPIYSISEKYISEKKVINAKKTETVEVLGM